MFTFEDLQERATGPRELVRAQEILERGKIESQQWSDLAVALVVRGSGKKPYDVRLNLTLDGTCTCTAYLRSARRYCKHLLAAGLLWLNRAGAGPDIQMNDLDQPLVDRVAALSEPEMRALLVECAGRYDAIRTRLLDGDWPPER